jgi:hypothetical protein
MVHWSIWSHVGSPAVSCCQVRSSALARVLPNWYTEYGKLLGNKEECLENYLPEEMRRRCRKLLPTVSPGLVSAASMS